MQRKYDLVEALDALAKEAGLPLAHLAMAFAAEHPAVTSAIIGPRTMEQALEGMSLCSAARKAQTPGVVAFLKKQK